MAKSTEGPEPKGCDDSCRSAPSIEALNRTCYCLSVDPGVLRRELQTDLGLRGLSRTLVETHPHLFASRPVFVARWHLEQMARVIEAVETVVETLVYRRAALAWAPDIASFDPGVRGGLLGYDFHLTDAGPQLIEINTNPGGALLNAVLGRAQRACCTDAAGLVMGPMEAGDVVVSPHPRAHALYADKRNLTLLCDTQFLRATSVADEVLATLLAGIPRTELMTAENRAAMWANRRHLFFKPAAGYGSKATYRGDKITKRVWEDRCGEARCGALVPRANHQLPHAGWGFCASADQPQRSEGNYLDGELR